MPCQEPPAKLSALQSLSCSSLIYNKKVSLLWLVFLLPARMLEICTHFREITFISHRKDAFTRMGLEIHCVMFQSSSNFSLCYLVHEGTLVHAVSVLSQWSSRLTVEVPTALLDWLKKAFTLKTSTSLVRHAYLQAMLGAFRGRSHEGCYATCGIYRSLN